MAKSFEYEGTQYDLSMTRAGVRAAEQNGLTTSEMTEKPFSAIVGLFFAALYSRYKVNPSKAANMLDHVLDSKQMEFAELFEELAEEYGELFGSGGSD